MPLQRRLPKFGFTNIFRVEFRGINLDVIQSLAEAQKIASLTPEVFIKNGLASKNDKIKILGRGELKSKLEIKAHAFSAGAKTAIEAKGGKAEVI